MDEKAGSKDTSKDIAKSWSQYLQKKTSQGYRPYLCPECGDEIPNGAEYSGFRKHFTVVHSAALAGRGPDEAGDSWMRSLWKTNHQQVTDRYDARPTFFKH
jgi:hypothetical protein